jgi:triacylglycerol lipase
MKNIFFKTPPMPMWQYLLRSAFIVLCCGLISFTAFIFIAKNILDHAEIDPHLPESCDHLIVFHHGFFPLLSMHRFAKELRDMDGLCVVSTELSPALSVRERSSQLKDFLDPLRSRTGARKISIIGHSQGGLDARALVTLHGYGEYVEQIVTLATPHRGSRVAHRMYGLLYWTGLYRIVNPLIAFMFSYSGPVDVLNILHDLRQSGFDFADDPRVRYRSFAGVCGIGTASCWVDIFHFPQNVLLYLSEGVNDSVVSLESARWGESLTEVATTHAGFVGYRKIIGRFDFEPMNFYRELVWDILGLP